MSNFYSPNSNIHFVNRTNKDRAAASKWRPLIHSWLNDEWTLRVGQGTSVRSKQKDGSWQYTHGVCRPDDKIIELDGTLLGADFNPKKIRFSRPSTLEGAETFFGVLVHEVGHAEFTKYSLDEINAQIKAGKRREVQVAFLLEESRMEHRVVAEHPVRASWLRYCSSNLIASWAPTMKLQGVCLLVLARGAAKTFDNEMIKAVRSLLDDLNGKDFMNKVEKLWVESVKLDDDNFDGLMSVATRWVALFDAQRNKMSAEDAEDIEDTEFQWGPEFEIEDNDDNDEGDDDSDPSESDENNDDESQPSDEEIGDLDESSDPDLPENIVSAIVEAMDSINKSVAQEMRDTGTLQASANEPSDPEAEQKANRKIKDANQAQLDSNEVFSIGNGGPVLPVHVTWEPPTDKHSVDSLRISNFLRDYLYRPPRVTRYQTQTPGGKVNMKRLAHGKAQRAVGAKVTAKPWTNRNVQQVPPLAIDIAMALDQSGTMGGIINMLTGAAWSIADAATQFDTRFAACTFGTSVAPLVGRGRRLEQVPYIQANACGHMAGPALSALDGEIGLSVPSKRIKVVIIFSDGLWGPEESGKASYQLERLRKSGALTFMAYTSKQSTSELHGCVPLLMNSADEWVDVFIDALKQSVR